MASSSPPFLHPHSRIPHSAPLLLFLLLLLPSVSLAVNVTTLLAAFPDLSDFNRLLGSTPVVGDLTRRSSLTLLAVPNSYLLRFGDLGRSAADIADIADVLRYHVLLEYLSWSDLHRIPAAGKLVATLYQTTGRAFNNLGAVNLTRDPRGGAVTARSPVPYSTSNATILSLVESLPYNVSIFAVDALLVPYGFDLAASEPAAPRNITQVLVDGRDFNVAASMLEASGVAAEFEADERGAGITVFVPTDEAFAELPATERLQSLPAEQKAVVLRFHVLHSYYPLGSLESIVNPVQPTLATEATEAGRFTLNISRFNGSVAIDTGVVQASITRTVFDQNPVAVFAVSRVLLPKEIFGKDSPGGGGGGGGGGAKPRLGSGAELASPPAQAGASAPKGADGVETPPTRLSSPPRFSEDIRSAAAARSRGFIIVGDGVALLCIGYLYLLW